MSDTTMPLTPKRPTNDLSTVVGLGSASSAASAPGSPQRLPQPVSRFPRFKSSFRSSRTWLSRFKGPGRRGQLQFRCFLITYCAYGAIFWLRKPLSVIKHEMHTELELSLPQLSFLDAALLLPLALVQIFGGRLGERSGPRRVIAFCMLTSAVATISIGFWSSYTIVAILLCISGACQSLVFPKCIKALSLWYPGEGQSILYGFWGTTSFLASILATAMSVSVKNYFGWRHVFFLPSIVVAGVGFFVYQLLRLPSGASGSTSVSMHSENGIPRMSSTEVLVKGDALQDIDEEDIAGDAEKEEIFEIESANANRTLGIKEVIKLPMVMDIGVAYLCLNTLRYTLFMWLPLYLSAEVGYSTDDAGYLSTAFELGGLIGSALLGILADRVLSGRKILASQIAMVFSSGMLVAFYLSRSWGAVFNFGFLMLVGLGNGGTDLILSGSVAVDLGARADCVSSVSGFIGGMGVLGAVIQGPLIGFATHHFGTSGVVVIMSILAAVPIISVVRTKELDSRHRQREVEFGKRVTA